MGFAINNAFAEGGEGAVDLANLVVETIERKPSAPLQYTYGGKRYRTAEDRESGMQPLWRKCSDLQQRFTQDDEAYRRKWVLHIIPVCIAKTQYSFSADPKIYGAVNNFEFHIKDIVINNGAEMLVAIAGEILRMAGAATAAQASTST